MERVWPPGGARGTVVRPPEENVQLNLAHLAHVMKWDLFVHIVISVCLLQKLSIKWNYFLCNVKSVLFIKLKKWCKQVHSCVVLILVNTFDGIDRTQLGESNSFTKIGRTFFGNVDEILPDFRNKIFYRNISSSIVISISDHSGLWVCGLPLTGTVGLNLAGGIDVCLLWVLCVVR